MGSVTYLSNFNTVNLTRDPFDDCYYKNIEFPFDFMIQDYTIIGSDKCVAVSRDGWISVAYDSSDQESHGMSFQMHLDPEEYVDCISSDSSTNFICVATSVRNSASTLVFWEIVGDQQIFLVESSCYFFSEDGPRPNVIAEMSTDMSYCGESVLVIFESGVRGGIFTFTVNDEGGFVNFATSEFTKMWTLDSSGTLKRISREYLLGIESEFKNANNGYSSDHEDEEVQTQTPYDWTAESSSQNQSRYSINQVKVRGSNISRFQTKRARFDSLSDDEVVQSDSKYDEEDQYTSRARLRPKKKRYTQDDQDEDDTTGYTDHRWNNCSYDEGVFTDDITGINEGEEFEDDAVDRAAENQNSDLNSID